MKFSGVCVCVCRASLATAGVTSLLYFKTDRAVVVIHEEDLHVQEARYQPRLKECLTTAAAVLTAEVSKLRTDLSRDLKIK